jgi:general secretion pathway protein G
MFAEGSEIPIVARPSGCRIETRLDAWRSRWLERRKERRDESRRRRHECPRHSSCSGMTLIELIVACTIMMLLTYMAVPMARNRVRRQKERELHMALDEIRRAIDRYKDEADKNSFGPIKVGTEGYPETLEILVEGVKIANQVDKKVKFLRRIPLDPMTNTRDWGKRSMQDDPKSTAWGGQNVFDVYTNSFDKARDGTPYSEW